VWGTASRSRISDEHGSIDSQREEDMEHDLHRTGDRAGDVLAGAAGASSCTGPALGTEHPCVTFWADNLARWRAARSARP
jgi:hypothetical protein